MRYILGVSKYDKITGDKFEYLAVVDNAGLYPSIYRIDYIEKKLDEDQEIHTMVFDSVDEIQKIISEYTVMFRKENIKKNKKTKYILNFYALKVDSSKFPFKVSKTPSKSFKAYKTNKTIYNLEKK